MTGDPASRSGFPAVELRSDTFTRPTAGMRAAMAAASVGDDVYGEDPSVNTLQERVAAMFGHEAALFVPTGTMGNQVAIRLVVPPAGELLVDADAHIVTYEGAGQAENGSIQTRTVVSPRGLLDPDAVAEQIRPGGYGMVVTRAVAVEQTHNRGGGAVYPLARLAALREIATAAGVALHCDGARVWNAHIATGVPLTRYGALFDTLSVCLSKGLGAPVGSLVVADRERIATARVLRRRLGGGMRQAGVLAAAGTYALDHHLTRLADDHARAARLAAALAEVAPDAVDPEGVPTNIVPIDLAGRGRSAPALAAAAGAHGVRVGVVGPFRLRCLTHLDVDDAGIDRAVEVLGDLLR